MIGVQDFEAIKRRFTRMWNLEPTDRCCISVTYTEPDAEQHWEGSGSEEKRAARWTDPERILQRNLERFEATYFAGDAFPLIWLNLGPAGHAGMIRDVPVRFADTVWFHAMMEDELDASRIVLDPQSLLYQKTFEIGEYLCRHSQGRYLVSMPDVCGNLDVLAAIRGSEELMIDLLAGEEAEVRACLERIQGIWEHVVRKAYAMIRENNDGGSSIGWLHTWAPGFHGQMQCDLSVMISNTLFERYARPELEAQSTVYEYSLYHLDGIEQLRHLDTLLSIPALKMIQWTSVAGQPSPLEYLPVLEKIQRAGKGLLLNLQPHEIAPALKRLSSRGLMILTEARSRQEADYAVEMAEQWSADRSEA